MMIVCRRQPSATIMNHRRHTRAIITTTARTTKTLTSFDRLLVKRNNPTNQSSSTRCCSSSIALTRQQNLRWNNSRTTTTRQYENYWNRYVQRQQLYLSDISSCNSGGGGSTRYLTSTSSAGAATENGTAATSSSHLVNELCNIMERPGGVDQLIHTLNDTQRRELASMVSKASASLAAAHTTTPYVVPEPSRNDLKIVAITTAIPFVGFGIMDNSILIIAGDAIDTSLGVTLGISTMCAAAIGNIISDVAGIGLGTAIEDFCALYLNLPVPQITTAQRQLRSVRFANQLGCGVGIVIGCIIGMFPLLLIDSNKVQIKKREAHLDSIFQDVITQAGALVNATRVCLYLRVDDPTAANPVPSPDGRYLYIKYDNTSAAHPEHQQQSTSSNPQSTSSATKNNNNDITSNANDAVKKSSSTTSSKEQQGSDVAAGGSATTTSSSSSSGLTRKDRFVPIGRGIVSRALLTGESWNIVDVQSEPDFVPDLGYVDWEDATMNAGRKTKTMICVPIMDGTGRPIAVIQAVNKVDDTHGSHTNHHNHHDNNSNVVRFTENDVLIIKALASHISVSLQQMYEQQEGAEAEIRLRDTIRILKEYGLAGIESDSNNSKKLNQHPQQQVRFSKNYSNRPLFPDDE